MGLGICMDINPCKFEAPWEAYEWARFCLAENVQVHAMLLLRQYEFFTIDLGLNPFVCASDVSDIIK